MSPPVQFFATFAKIAEFWPENVFFAPKSPILVRFSKIFPRVGTHKNHKIEKMAFSGPILGMFRGSKSNSLSSIFFSRLLGGKSFAGSTPFQKRNMPKWAPKNRFSKNFFRLFCENGQIVGANRAKIFF